MLGEYDGNNNLLRKYIYGPGIDQPVSMIEVADANAAYYYHFDALGSVVALSDAAGDTVQTYEYSVYGEVAVEDTNHTNPYMFAGVRYDIEIGLYYNRARYYNPFTGRFLQTDPVGYGAGMNLYAYCKNSPLVYTDPSGLFLTLEVMTATMLSELYEYFDSCDLYFIWDGCDLWVTSDPWDIYDWNEPLLLSEGDDDNLKLTEASSDWPPGFEKYVEKRKQDEGLPPDYSVKGKQLKEWIEDYRGGDDSSVSKPKGKNPRRRVRELGHEIWAPVITAVAEGLAKLPSDEALKKAGMISTGVSIAAGSAVIFGPAVIGAIAARAAPLVPAI